MYTIRTNNLRKRPIPVPFQQTLCFPNLKWKHQGSFRSLKMGIIIYKLWYLW